MKNLLQQSHLFFVMKQLSHTCRTCRLRRLLLYFNLLLLVGIVVILLMLTGVDKDGVSHDSPISDRLFRFWSKSRLQEQLMQQQLKTTLSPQQTERSIADGLAMVRNGSVHCKDVQSLFPNRIPPVIHWTNKDQRILHGHHEMLRSWLKVLGNTVAYMYWEDKDVDQLIVKHYPGLVSMYRKLRVGIMRSDIARLVILHHVGGVYSDLDVTLLRSIHGMMVNYTALWSQEPMEHVYYMYKRIHMLSNALFMTKARHKYLDYVLNSWPNWFQSQWSNRVVQLNDPNKAIYITGPLMLNGFLDKYVNLSDSEGRVHLAHPDQFQPVWDSWFAQSIAKKQCMHHRKTMPPEHRRHCDLLAARRFVQRQMQPNVTYGVHRFLHTSYGKGNNYAKAKPAKDILPLSRCII